MLASFRFDYFPQCKIFLLFSSSVYRSELLFISRIIDIYLVFPTSKYFEFVFIISTCSVIDCALCSCNENQGETQVNKVDKTVLVKIDYL